MLLGNNYTNDDQISDGQALEETWSWTIFLVVVCFLFMFFAAALALKVGRQERQILNCSYSVFCKLKFLLPFGDWTQ